MTSARTTIGKTPDLLHSCIPLYPPGTRFRMGMGTIEGMIWHTVDVREAHWHGTIAAFKVKRHAQQYVKLLQARQRREGA